jgi:hypothetical protein
MHCHNILCCVCKKATLDNTTWCCKTPSFMNCTYTKVLLHTMHGLYNREGQRSPVCCHCLSLHSPTGKQSKSTIPSSHGDGLDTRRDHACSGARGRHVCPPAPTIAVTTLLVVANQQQRQHVHHQVTTDHLEPRMLRDDYMYTPLEHGDTVSLLVHVSSENDETANAIAVLPHMVYHRLGLHHNELMCPQGRTRCNLGGCIQVVMLFLVLGERGSTC